MLFVIRSVKLLVATFLTSFLVLFWWLSPFPVLRDAVLVPSISTGNIANTSNADDVANTNNTGIPNNDNISSDESPPPKPSDKVVVIAKMKTEDTAWVAEDLPDWQHAIYHMDEPEALLHPPKNKGREAMAYLTYLIDYYDNLPPTIAFIHPHKGGWPAAWHTDANEYKNSNSLNSLKIDYVQEHGYANLRCIHDPGCPAEIQPFREPYDADRSTEHAMVEAWHFMFPNNMTVPSIIATPCCSQFAVSSAQVRARPKEDYVRYRDWILQTPLSDDVSGRVMEYIWHIYFGRDAVQSVNLLV